MKAKFNRAAVLALALLLSVFIFSSAAAEKYFFDLFNFSESSDGYYTMKDRKDSSVILRTARILHPGDEYIDQANRHFRVVMLEEKTAWVEQIKSQSPLTGDARGSLPSGGEMAAGSNQNAKPAVGIYHTHGAESYVPTDGTETIDQGGGILQVGDALTRALENKGFDVNHVREPHTPHDAGAYQRSRRTAEELVTEGDQLIFDVHRDAVPPEEYEETVEGEEVTKILLVLGQQNQNADNNRNFAVNLKQIADEEHPGLVKGILGAQATTTRTSPRRRCCSRWGRMKTTGRMPKGQLLSLPMCGDLRHRTRGCSRRDRTEHPALPGQRSQSSSAAGRCSSGLPAHRRGQPGRVQKENQLLLRTRICRSAQF